MNYRYLIKNNRFINYEHKILNLNDKGMEKIEEIVNFIKDLPVDFLETKPTRLLRETESFPFVELLPIILEILISQDLQEHQLYFCLKILQNLFKLGYSINNVEIPLAKIYLKYFWFPFILEVFNPYRNKLIKVLENIKNIKNITEWYAIYKLTDKNKNKNKIISLEPRNDFEKQIKNQLF